MSLKPLIILAFPHSNTDTQSTDPRNLLKEQSQIQSLLYPLQQQNNCDITVLNHCHVDQLQEEVKKEGHRLIGLHYASDIATLIKMREGKLKSMERALKGKLGKYLGSLEQLKWVFLNGDGSQEQAEALIQFGVPVVIRSQNMISDDAAFRFAFFFYQALAQGVSLGKACYIARDEAKSDYSHKAKLSYALDLPSGYGSDWPFDFHVNPNRWQPLLWSIHYQQKAYEEGMSRLIDQPLPALPFKDFEAFFEEDSGLFFGRLPVIRMIYDALMMTTQRKPFLILSGGKGEGKTSLVCSSLGIRLKDDFEVRYQPFENDGLSTLSAALGVDENAYLGKEWHSIEGNYSRQPLKQQVITDLMNEVQAAFRKNYRSDKIDFQTDFHGFLNTLKALWLQNEQTEGDNLLGRLGEFFEQQKRLAQMQNIEDEEEAIRPLLVFIDDMEKAFELKDENQKDRQVKFWELLKILAFDHQRQMKGSIVFIIDEQYSALLERELSKQNLGWHKFDIPPMNQEIVADYLRRFAQDFKFKEHYPILIDDRFAQTVANDLCKIDEPIGWRLHALLRLLWQRSPRKPVKWTLEAYEPIQKQGLTLNALLIQRIDDFLQSAKLQMADDELKEELMVDILSQLPKDEEIDVEELLKQYLQFESQLGEPWENHREMIKFQSIWFFNQCIEAGLIEGYLNLGDNLPKGKLKLIHPSLYDAIQEKKKQLLFHHPFLLHKLKLLMAQKQVLSDRDTLQEMKAMFFQRALPTLDQAEYLRKIGDLIQQGNAQSNVAIDTHFQPIIQIPKTKTNLGYALQYAPLLLLILTIGTCVSIQQNKQKAEQSYQKLQHQMMLGVGNEQLKASYPQNTISILKEIIQGLDLNKYRNWAHHWQQLAIKAMYKNIPKKIQSSKWIIKKTQITENTILNTYQGDQSILYDVQTLKGILEFAGTEWIENNGDGKHWISLEGNELKFWSIQTQNMVVKKIQSTRLKKLFLNQEGTIAVLLDDQGVVQLHRSHDDYPMTQLKGHEGAMIEDVSISPDHRAIALIDKNGHIQKYSLNQSNTNTLILAPVIEENQTVSVKQVLWTSQKSTQSSAELGLIVHYQGEQKSLIKYYPEKDKNTSNSNAKTVYEGEDQVITMTSSDQNGRLLYALSNEQLIYEQLLNAGLSAKKIKLNLKAQAEDELIKISHDGKKALVKLDSKVSLITLDPLQTKMIPLSKEITLKDFEFSNDDLLISARHNNEIQVWDGQAGFMRESIDLGNSEVLGAKIFDQQLIAVADRINQAQRTELYQWDLNQGLQYQYYWFEEEIELSSALKQSQMLVTTNSKGNIYLWYKQNLIASINEKQKPSQIIELADQKLLIIAFEDELRAYPLIEGNQVSQLSGNKPLELKSIFSVKHSQSISSMTVSANYLISADQSGQIKFSNLQGKLIGEWKGAESNIKHLAISPKEDLLLSASYQKAKIWRLQGNSNQITAQQAKEFSVNIDKSEFDDQALYITSVEGSLDKISLNQQLELNQLIPKNSQLIGGKVVCALDLKNQLFWVQAQKNVLLKYDLSAKKPVESMSLSSAYINQILPYEQSLLLGDVEGQIWFINQDQQLLIGQHKSEILELQIKENALLSRSIDQTMLWLGKWDLQSLQEQIKAFDVPCLSVDQRIALLGEEEQEANEKNSHCRNQGN